MSMLKATMLLQVLVTNKVLAADEIDGVDGGSESIEKWGKLLKTRKMLKGQKLFKSQKSAKSEKKLTKKWEFTLFPC